MCMRFIRFNNRFHVLAIMVSICISKCLNKYYSMNVKCSLTLPLASCLGPFRSIPYHHFTLFDDRMNDDNDEADFSMQMLAHCLLLLRANTLVHPCSTSSIVCLGNCTILCVNMASLLHSVPFRSALLCYVVLCLVMWNSTWEK